MVREDFGAEVKECIAVIKWDVFMPVSEHWLRTWPFAKVSFFLKFLIYFIYSFNERDGERGRGGGRDRHQNIAQLWFTVVLSIELWSSEPQA